MRVQVAPGGDDVEVAEQSHSDNPSRISASSESTTGSSAPACSAAVARCR